LHAHRERRQEDELVHRQLYAEPQPGSLEIGRLPVRPLRCELASISADFCASIALRTANSPDSRAAFTPASAL
jgi:hypothetical protein